MRHPKTMAIILTTTMLSACTEPDGSPGKGVMHGGVPSKEEIGTAVGVVSGGVIGSTIGAGAGNTLAVIGGALLGGVLGNAVGKSLDNADTLAYDRASQKALESGQRQSWSNPDSGHKGTITPSTQYTNDANQLCRKYTQSIYVNGRKHTGHGTACREVDGTWKIING